MLLQRERERVTKTTRSFTLIELLIVIAIIGILAALIIVSVTSVAAKARDVKRQEDLRNIQKALEMYYTINGSYPITSGFQGNCSNYGSHPISGSNGYVPNLAPTYISSLPLDPRQGINCQGIVNNGACYLYASQAGTDYKLMAFRTVETIIPTPTNTLKNFYDPHYGAESAPGDCTYSLYTPGAIDY